MKENKPYYRTNNIAIFVKDIAIAIAVIGSLGSIFAGISSSNIVIAISGICISLLTCLFLYAVGEGLQILDDLRTNTEHIRDRIEREEK